MKPQYYWRLVAIAARWSRRADEAEDLVQDALIEAVRQRRENLTEDGNFRWVAGVIRNRARMAARGAVRRRQRETAWRSLAAPTDDATDPTPGPADISSFIEGLPRALKAVAALALSGHNRREIAYLLDLEDAALRQRIAGLRRILKARGIAMPRGLPGLNLDLAYGRIRDSLLPELRRHGGIFASHDPDGHLFIVRRSRNP